MKSKKRFFQLILQCAIQINLFALSALGSTVEKDWSGPAQFVVLSTADHFDGSKQNGGEMPNPYKIIHETYGSFAGKELAIGVAPMFRVFQKDMDIFISEMKNHLKFAQVYKVPVFFCLSSFVFNNARPDLWNWWDPNAPGYNPGNRNNVEWFDWTPDSAVKIGWLNWGNQMRLPPMPNLMSPVFRAEVRKAFQTLGSIVKDWYDQLPQEDKWLLIGFRSTDEVAIGINNWYYPEGNSYLGKDPSEDPKTRLKVKELPSRGVQTIGYAAVKTAGLKSYGVITMKEINEVCRLHCENCSKILFDLGFPREKIFSSAFGKSVEECKTCITNYSSPSWSFYHQEALHPEEFDSAVNALKFSDAPCWAMAEWGIGANSSSEEYLSGLKKGLDMQNCRFIRLTGEWFRNPMPKAKEQVVVSALQNLLYKTTNSH